MSKLNSLLKLLNEENSSWWDSLSKEQQSDYIANHPNSKYAVNAKKKENDSKKKSKKVEEFINGIRFPEDTGLDSPDITIFNNDIADRISIVPQIEFDKPIKNWDDLETEIFYYDEDGDEIHPDIDLDIPDEVKKEFIKKWNSKFTDSKTSSAKSNKLDSYKSKIDSKLDQIISKGQTEKIGQLAYNIYPKIVKALKPEIEKEYDIKIEDGEMGEYTDEPFSGLRGDDFESQYGQIENADDLIAAIKKEAISILGVSNNTKKKDNKVDYSDVKKTAKKNLSKQKKSNMKESKLISFKQFRKLNESKVVNDKTTKFDGEFIYEMLRKAGIFNIGNAEHNLKMNGYNKNQSMTWNQINSLLEKSGASWKDIMKVSNIKDDMVHSGRWEDFINY